MRMFAQDSILLPDTAGGRSGRSCCAREASEPQRPLWPAAALGAASRAPAPPYNAVVKPPAVSFVLVDGRRERHPVALGDTVLDCALDNGVVGLVGQCGGACNCSTCHCYVDSPWLERLPPMIDDERALLEYAWHRRHNSRLACQISMTPALDGIVVRMPERQT